MLTLGECLMGSALTHRARARVRQRSSIERPIQASLSHRPVMSSWSVARALESKAHQALLIEGPIEKNVEKQVGFGINAPS